MKKYFLIVSLMFFCSSLIYGQDCNAYKNCTTETQRAQFIATHLMKFCKIKIDNQKEYKSLAEIHKIVKAQAEEIKDSTIDARIDAAINAQNEGYIVMGFVGNAHFFHLNKGVIESGNWKRKMPLVFDMPWKNTECDDNKGLNFFCGTRENNYKITFYKVKKTN